jgi:hypothetical protein
MFQRLDELQTGSLYILTGHRTFPASRASTAASRCSRRSR